MAREFAKRLYNSKAWQRCRDSYIKSVHGLCERCLSKGRVVPGYIVHHKVHLDATNIDDTSVTLNHGNLEYLCQTCHQQEHTTTMGATADGVEFDEHGDVVVSRDSLSPPP